MSAPQVSVIVVSYNTRDLLRQCLRSIEPHHEIVVVDNASHDGSADMVVAEFPDAVLIRNEKNVGFGVANNQGMDAASGDYVLLLNSDAEARPGAIDLLESEMYDDLAAVGGKLVFPDGRIQESAANDLTLWVVFCEQLYLEKVFKSYWRSSKLPKGGEVEQVMGACLMMERNAAKFDERFFLYCEDTELCHRLRWQGQIRYVPQAEFVHHLGASTSGRRWWSVAMYNRGKELYFLIHHGKVKAFACFLLNRLGALLRCFVKPKTFWRVLTAPLKGPSLP
jgi:GT2 family glycosyltransferase